MGVKLAKFRLPKVLALQKSQGVLVVGGIKIAFRSKKVAGMNIEKERKSPVFGFFMMACGDV